MEDKSAFRKSKEELANGQAPQQLVPSGDSTLPPVQVDGQPSQQKNPATRQLRSWCTRRLMGRPSWH